MGKGRILSGGEDGYYQIELVRDIARVTARLQRIDARAQELASEILLAEAELVQAEQELALELFIYHELIELYRQQIATQEAILEQAEVVAEKGVAHRRAEQKLARLTLELAGLDKERQALQGVDEKIPMQAWCADLTEDLAAGVQIGTVEIPGERQRVLVRPAYNGRATYNQARDGALQPTQSSSAAMVVFNWTMMPGWQKWMPTYRTGEIQAIDYAAGTCRVTYDAEQSSINGLPVNHLQLSDDVPIEYMDCDSMAFSIGDKVLVEFEEVNSSQAPENWNKPKVIGFEDNPKACPVFMESAFVELPPGGAVGKLYYTDALKTACCGEDAYLDWLRPETLTGATRAYSAGMDSLTFPAGHDQYGFVSGNFASQSGKLLKLHQCLAGQGAVAAMIKEPATKALTYALYTTPAGLYFLLRITDTAVFSAPLEFSPGGDILLAGLLLDHGARISRFSAGHAELRKREAYLLGEAVGIGDWTQIGTIATTGDPIARGWQSSWDCDALAIVTQERVMFTPSPDPGFQCVQHIRARIYSLVITRAGGQPAGVVLTEEEAVNWTPSLGKDGIFYEQVVDDVVHNQQWFPYTCQCGNGGYQYPAWLNADAPVGCYWAWTPNEDLVIARHFREALPTRSKSALYAERNAQESRENLFMCGAGSVQNEYVGHTGGTTSGFYLTAFAEAAKAELQRKEGSGIYSFLRYYTSGSGQWQGCTFTFLTDPDFTCDPNADVQDYGGCTQFKRRVRNDLAYAYRDNRTEDNMTEDGENVLVFPAHTSEALYLGRLQYVHQGNLRSVLGRQYTAMQQNQLNNGGTVIASWRTRIPSLNVNPITGNYDGGWSGTQLVSDVTAASDFYRVKWVLATRAGAVMVEEITAPGSGGGEGGNDLGNYRLLFDAEPCGQAGGRFTGGLIACQQSLAEYLATGSLNQGPHPIASGGVGDADTSKFLNGSWIGWS